MFIEKIGKPAMLEQLAEEAAELGQAALKLARKLRNENPTPVTIDDAVANLSEEVTDVSLCLNELKIYPVKDIYEYKRARWLGRLEEAGCSHPCNGKGGCGCGGKCGNHASDAEETSVGCGPDGCDVTDILYEDGIGQPEDKCAAWLRRVSGSGSVGDADDTDLRDEMFSRNHGG